MSRPLDARRSDDPSCCPTADPRIARRFDAIAGDWADADDMPDMVDVSAQLLDLLRDAPRREPSVLELGCGTGALAVALLEMGADQVTGIDLSPASVELAAHRADVAGFGTRATFAAGNAVEAAATRHDWVILDRVICCFDDPERLVARATALAVERIGITVPESRGWRGLVNRPLWAAENAWDLLHRGCRGFVHDVRSIERRLAEAGFARTRTARAGLWHVAVYDASRIQPPVKSSPRPDSRSRGA